MTTTLRDKVWLMLPESLKTISVYLTRYWWYIKTFIIDLVYKLKSSDKNALPMPPVTFRYRVASKGGTARLFDELGKQVTIQLADALQAHDLKIDHFHSIMEFGVGCSRIMRWTEHWSKHAKLYGTDLDEEMVCWNQKHIPHAEFNVNKPLPPLSYIDSQFDLIYAISVFTHLDEIYQDMWLKELNRLIAPGGILLLSVHGKELWEIRKQNVKDPISSIDNTKYENDGIAFIRGRTWQGIFPSFYQATYHSKQYIYDHWGQYFEIVDYFEQKIWRQDLVMLRKPDVSVN